MQFSTSIFEQHNFFSIHGLKNDHFSDYVFCIFQRESFLNRRKHPPISEYEVTISLPKLKKSFKSYKSVSLLLGLTIYIYNIKSLQKDVFKPSKIELYEVGLFSNTKR